MPTIPRLLAPTPSAPTPPRLQTTITRAAVNLHRTRRSAAPTCQRARNLRRNRTNLRIRCAISRTSSDGKARLRVQTVNHQSSKRIRPPRRIPTAAATTTTTTTTKSHTSTGCSVPCPPTPGPPSSRSGFPTTESTWPALATTPWFASTPCSHSRAEQGQWSHGGTSSRLPARSSIGSESSSVAGTAWTPWDWPGPRTIPTW
mmetsp:Transcript_15709/g.36322  ORF Transcript_15709/g.36322 Transcript_15709/m.36322 type:complete len:202 (-) Transcript_15709:3194-3799(-)